MNYIYFTPQKLHTRLYKVVGEIKIIQRSQTLLLYILWQVWVLAMRVQGPETSIDKNFNEPHTYPVGTICIILLFTTVSVVLIVTASQRVTKLRVALKE